MSQTSYDREIYLQDLLADMEAANQVVHAKWDSFLSHLESNKSRWDDTQYFYFHKRVEEIGEGLRNMDIKLKGPIRDFIEDNITHYKNIQNK